MDPAAKKKICWACKKEGHAKKNCPNKEDESMSSGFERGTILKVLCWKCKRTGHVAASCPQVFKVTTNPYKRLVVPKGNALAIPEGKSKLAMKEKAKEETSKPSVPVKEIPVKECKEEIPWWHPLSVSEFNYCKWLARKMKRPLRKVVELQKADLEFRMGKRKALKLDDRPKGHGDITYLEDVFPEEIIPEKMETSPNLEKDQEEFIRVKASVQEPDDKSCEDKSLKNSEKFWYMNVDVMNKDLTWKGQVIGAGLIEGSMETREGSSYDAFQEKLRRTVCVDNLSPLVTESVVRSALDQFRAVKSVEFIPNYTNTKNMPRCALVEFEEPEQAKSILELITEFPLMIGGMPRPVTASPATVGMFADHPQKPGRRIEIQWLEPDDPIFETAQKLKRLAQKHTAEASFLVQRQLIEEENLSKQHQDIITANYDKYQKMDGIKGSARHLAQYYDMNVLDD